MSRTNIVRDTNCNPFVPAETVSACKGADLFTGRFTERFGAA
ncbi:hypothetical protein [Planomonospora parontospora]|nr:hypothetical protein [Planomonospora parontospora]